MAESYWPFDAGTGAASTETRWRAMAQHWLTSGVIATDLNKLSTIGDSTGMQVKMDTGRAWVLGHFYENDAQRTLAISSNSSGNPRIDRVVLRADFTANTITATVITGTPAGSPSAPALTRSSTVWDLPLAQVAVANGAVTITSGNVTDERPLVAPSMPGGPIVPSSTARDLHLPSPVAGQIVSRSDVERIERYNGSTWVPMLPFGDGAVSTWTPQVDQGGSTNIAKTVNEARYIEIGPLVLFWFDLTMTAAGTGSNAISVTTPVTTNHPGSAVSVIGACTVYDASGGPARSVGHLELNTGKLYLVYANAGAVLAGTSATASFPQNTALASGDILRGSGIITRAA